MKKIILLISWFVIQSMWLNAQSVGINTTTPHPNASLDIKGVNKGLLIPRGDVASRTALNSNPAKGLMMYDTITNNIWIHNGNGLASGWQSLSTGTNHWTLNGALGTEIANTNAGGFWSANPSTVLSDPGPVQPPASNGGTRMMWIPQRSAFRVGTVTSNHWNADSIGLYSVAMGINTKAIGEISFALGTNSRAKGSTSFAMGINAGAIGDLSVAFGSNTLASGNTSTAMGSSTKASGFISFATGYLSIANGSYSTSMGVNTKAGGESATATGYYTTANGRYSASSGFFTNARSYGSTVLGRFNDSLAISNTTTWVNTDPLWIIGNGTSPANPHNAMVVYKNGNMILKNPAAFYYNKLPVNYQVPVNGEGTRLMWIPEISAFRVGTAIDSAWNSNKMGIASFAAGINSTASGYLSFATGIDTKASGELSTAMGYGNIARGYSSMAVGMFNNPILTADETEEATPETPLFMIGNGNDYAMRHNAMVIYKNGNVLWKNKTTIIADPGSLVVPISGGGTRMMWIPEKSAFRVGTVTGNAWDEANVGTWSSAIGYQTTATGLRSIAMGAFTTAAGTQSIAMGTTSTASGLISTAMGNSTLASGDQSTSMGNGTRAIAANTTSMGFNTMARGGNSVVMNTSNIAKGYSSTVIGMYNDSIVTSDEHVPYPTTPLFIVGNGDGTAVGERKNAMVVRKDGHVGIGTSAPETFLHVDVGSNDLEGFLVEGLPVPGGFPDVPDLGSGNRMSFFTSKASFRAGRVDGTQWDNINTGNYSVAMGLNTTASQTYSIAMGIGSIASDFAAVAFGSNTKATGNCSVAMGQSTRASGASSTAFGNVNFAKSAYSFVNGTGNIAKGYASTVVGMYNDSIFLTEQTMVVDTTPLFIVGNGNNGSVGQRKNALVVYKSGNVDMNGYARLGKRSEAAPEIKMKKLTGTSAAGQNAWTNVAHGLTQSKILSVEVIMTVPGFVNVPASYTYHPGYEFNYQIATSNIVVINSAANSANILSKAFTILIVYEE